MTETSAVTRPEPQADTIQVWSDLLCPFTHVAIHRVMAARDKLGLTGKVRIDHHTFPLELFNGPHPRPGTDSEAVGLGQIEPDAGFRLWTGPEWEYPSTVLLAAEAVHAAKAQGLGPSEDLDRALRFAFWTHSRSISHRSVILEVAKETGTVDVDALAEALDSGKHRADVMSDYTIAQSDEVSGSPHLFLADGYSVANPGITVHWQGDWAKGFPVVDAHDSEWATELVTRAAA